MKRLAVAAVAVVSLSACASSPEAAPTGTTLPTPAYDVVCGNYKAIFDFYNNAVAEASTKYEGLPSQIAAATQIAAGDLVEFVKAQAPYDWPRATNPDLKDVLKRIARNDNVANEIAALTTICDQAS